MRKLLTILLLLSFAFPALAAHPGPAQWSLAGLASWSQPLTASGTVLPATTNYSIGDFFAISPDASETVALYRACASGTSVVWRLTTPSATPPNLLTIAGLPSVAGNGNKHLALATDTASFYWADPGSGSGGTTTLLGLTDLPDVTGNANKYLALGTDTASFYWLAAGDAAQAAADLAAHMDGDNYKPHSDRQLIGGMLIDGINKAIGFQIYPTEPIASLSVVVASGTDYIVAPASSVSAIGVYSPSYGLPETDSVVNISGDVYVLVADDSDLIEIGDIVITSDTTPGAVMRASVAGDSVLPYDEAQRRVGVCIGEASYEESVNATCTRILLRLR